MWSKSSPNKTSVKTPWSSRPYPKCLVRRCTSVIFLSDNQTLLVGDKSGDIYKFSLLDDSKVEGQLLLGSLAMLLDMTMTKNDEYIVTADRDEKVRISCYPNTYSIHQYCMGHKMFVKCLSYAENLDIIFSGSGDSTVRGWNLDGRELCCVQCGNRTQETRAKYHSPCDNPGRESFTVQNLIYVPTHQLLIVSLYQYMALEVYKVLTTDRVILNLQQVLPLPCIEVWSMAFRSDGHLLTLVPRQGHTLLIHRLTDDQFQDITGENGPMTTVQGLVNDQWDFFKDVALFDSVIPSLLKVPTNNISKYLDRKNQRIGQKRSQIQTQEQLSDVKRNKSPE